MPTTPWSQPGITWPAPSGKTNGWPRSQEASNCWPSRKRTPTYWTVTVSPGFAVASVPLTMSCLTSSPGASPGWCGMRGFLDRSLVGEARTPDEPVVDEAVVSACVCVSVWAGWLCAGLDAVLVVLPLSELPQPARTRAAASAEKETVRMWREASDESRRGDSNPWPPDYKSGALPTELLRPGSADASAGGSRRRTSSRRQAPV